MRKYLLAFTLLIASLSVGFGQGEFITMWSFYGNSIEFPVGGTGPIDYAWTTTDPGPVVSGTGTIPFSSSMLLSIINLPVDRVIRIEVNPINLNMVRAGDGIGIVALDSVVQWGSANWITMERAFNNCEYVSISNSAGTPNLGSVQSMFRMFNACERLGASDLSHWDVSNVTNMALLFNGCLDFNGDISTWDVSNVTFMTFMFAANFNFNQDISQWDVSSVQIMANMFAATSDFDQDLSQWNLSGVQNISRMFDNSGLSCENYSNFLVGQANNPNLPSGLELGATSLQYGTDAVAARNTLINTKGWTILGDSPSGTNCVSIPLPVELLNFTATNTDQGHHVAWSTASELNNSHFVLQHSMKGSDESFQELTVVEGKGSTSELSAYGYINKTNVAGTHYYRLKQVDFDGTSSFSDVVALTQGEATEISIYPNPADQSLTLSGILAGEQVMLTDALGRVVFQGAYNGEQLAIDHLPAGTYVLQGEQEGRGYTRRFVKL